MPKPDLNYKTFTASIETPTLLDSFVPATLTELEDRFQPILAIKKTCNLILLEGQAKLSNFSDFNATAHKLGLSASELDYLFEDFTKRIKYFTLVFFGAVSAGKTSMICDLSNTTPNQLTEIISNQEAFDPKRDFVQIGPNVATLNLYENLIEESRIRLVDVPGIGGVAHANETLAPFVNMADCVIFVLNAHGDITNDDVKFLRDHVAALESASEGQSLPSAERGAEKRVLVVINKWESAIGWKSREDAESAFESKRDWILHGRSDLGFKGIAGHFDKAPVVVRSETNVRDPKTGMPITNSKGNELGLTEVIAALENVLAEDGVDFRLNRPRLATIRSIRNVKNALNDEQTIGALKLLQKQFAVLGQRTDLAAAKVQQDLDDRLATLEEKLKYFISSRLKQVIHSWKPSVPFLEGLRGAVPEWFGWAGKVGLGKTQMQANLRVEWEEQLRPLIEQGLPAQELSNLLQKEADAIKRLVTSTFQMNLIDNPDLLEKIPGLSDRFNAGEGKVDILAGLKRDLDEAISKVQTGLMDDILGLLAMDMILAAIAGILLTPAASALLLAYRRWKRGEKKGDETRQELDGAIDKVAEQIALKIGEDIGKKFQERVTEVSAKIGSLIGEQQDSASGPLKIVEDIVQKLDRLLIELDQLQGTQPAT